MTNFGATVRVVRFEPVEPAAALEEPAAVAPAPVLEAVDEDVAGVHTPVST